MPVNDELFVFVLWTQKYAEDMSVADCWDSRIKQQENSFEMHAQCTVYPVFFITQ